MRWPRPFDEIEALFRKNQDDEAAALIEQLCQDVSPTQRREQIFCLHARANLHFRRIEVAEGEELTKKALALSEELPVDLPGKVVGLLGLTHCSWCRGDYPEVEQLAQEALSLSEQLGDQGLICSSIAFLGHLFIHRGEPVRAEPLYQRALAAAQATDDKWAILQTLGHLAQIYKQQGDWEQEEPLLQQRIDLVQQYPDHFQPGMIHGLRFRLAVRRAEEGIPDTTTEDQEHVRRIVQELDNPYLWHEYHLLSGRLHLAQHNLSVALEHAWQAKSESSLTDLEDQVAAIQLLLRIFLELYLLTNDAKHRTQLEGLVEELLATSKQHSLQAAYTEGLLIAAFLRRAVFDIPGATELFERVEQLAGQYGLRPLRERAHQELTNLQAQLTLQQQFHDQFPKAYEQAQMREMMSYLQGAQKLIRREEL